MSVTITAPTERHAGEIVSLMAPADLAIFARLVHPDEPAAALRTAVRDSLYGWCGQENDVPLCLGGLLPMSAIGDEGLVWMVAQPALGRHPKQFLRESKRIVDEMLRIRPVLVQAEPVDRERDLRWLRWLGFEEGTKLVINGVSVVTIRKTQCQSPY